MAYRDGITFDSVMADLLAAVPDTVDKREGSVIYDALAPAAAEIVKCYTVPASLGSEQTTSLLEVLIIV